MKKVRSLAPGVTLGEDGRLYNKARNNTNISIFDVGKGFYKEDGIYKEDLKLAG